MGMNISRVRLVMSSPILTFLQLFHSYGDCSVYKSKTGVCDGVVRLGIDHVYARSKLGDQSTIAQLINDNLKTVERVIADQNEVCVKQVFRALCNFYLPPCGNATHPIPPSSICQVRYLVHSL